MGEVTPKVKCKWRRFKRSVVNAEESQNPQALGVHGEALSEYIPRTDGSPVLSTENEDSSIFSGMTEGLQ